MVISGILVVTYTVIVLGGCSPVHFRVVITFVGLGCIFISARASEHIPIAMGYTKSEIHIMVPFLLLGVGVDDMFVICNAVDQTDINKSAAERMTEALSHAGPSISITSFTNSAAFFLGALTELLAIRSFCIYAGFAILTLYFVCITVFAAALVIDLRR